MKFDCTLRATAEGRWTIRHQHPAGAVEVTAASRADALERMRAELRYRCELCPCSGVPDDYVELAITELPRAG